MNDRPITPGDRRLLIASALALAAVALGAPLVTAGSARGLQLMFAILAATGFVTALSAPGMLVVALVATAAAAATSLIGASSASGATLAVSALAALGAAEGLTIARWWQTTCFTSVALERPHLVAAGRRVAIGAVVTTAVGVLGLIELPSPAVAAVAGVVAAATVIWASASRG